MNNTSIISQIYFFICMWEHFSILSANFNYRHIIPLGFIMVHRCCMFYKLRVRSFSSKKIMIPFIAVVWSWTRNISKVCLYTVQCYHLHYRVTDLIHLVTESLYHFINFYFPHLLAPGSHFSTLCFEYEFLKKILHVGNNIIQFSSFSNFWLSIMLSRFNHTVQDRISLFLNIWEYSIASLWLCVCETQTHRHTISQLLYLCTCWVAYMLFPYLGYCK